ncbi:FAD dependent oxidoreductase-domain-containing protein [Cladochytrium replicatum]|nr:FAD dependent oxidoreductase-domain-containing protein [Cladochytrium replicatum]
MAMAEHLPHPNPTQSYWLDGNDPFAGYRSTQDLPQYADIVILGCGITGASLAHALAKATELDDTRPTILILDARDPAGGATGRNGGHLGPSTFQHFRARAAQLSEQVWLRRMLFEQKCAKDLRELIIAEGWTEYVQLVQKGTVQAFDTLEEFQEAKIDVKAYKEALARFFPGEKMLDEGLEVWETEKAQKELCSTRFVGAIMNRGGAQLWPARLVYSLVGKSLEYPFVNLQTRTLVTGVERSQGNCWSISTHRGRVICSKVVHCTNGYVATLVPELQKRIYPVRGQVMSAKVNDTETHVPLRLWDFGMNMNEGHEYIVQRAYNANTIVFGGSRWSSPSKEVNESNDARTNVAITDSLTAILSTTFAGPGSRVAVDKVWTGIMGFSEDEQPWVGPIGQEGQFVAAGYTGHGMPNAFACAGVVAEQVLGRPVTNPYFLPDMMLPSSRLKWAARLSSTIPAHQSTRWKSFLKIAGVTFLCVFGTYCVSKW